MDHRYQAVTPGYPNPMFADARLGKLRVGDIVILEYMPQGKHNRFAVTRVSVLEDGHCDLAIDEIAEPKGHDG